MAAGPLRPQPGCSLTLEHKGHVADGFSGGESLEGTETTMQHQLVGEILAKRRDRAIAIVLGVKEREADRHLPPEARQKLRKVVLDQFNDLHDLCIDLVRSLDTGQVALNEEYLHRLDDLFDAIAALKED
jgi:hypothetical protein